MKNEKGEMDLPISHLIQAQKHLSKELMRLKMVMNLVPFSLFLLSSKEGNEMKKKCEGVRKGAWRVRECGGEFFKNCY